MHHPLCKVVGFEVVGDYTIRVEFDDVTEQVINFEPVLYGELLGPLRDLTLFNQVTLDTIAHTLTWPNGADFDPETLHNWPDYVEELTARSKTWAKTEEIATLLPVSNELAERESAVMFGGA